MSHVSGSACPVDTAILTVAAEVTRLRPGRAL